MNFEVGHLYKDAAGNNYIMLSRERDIGVFNFNRCVKRYKIIKYCGVEATISFGKVLFKSANILVAQLGNADRKETKLDKQSRDKIADQLSDYHKKGVVLLPYGIELNNVGNPVLPKVEEYIKSLKAMIYEGLMTPESLYSSESSNRSTAQIQLTSPETGHVLFIEYCQEFLKGWIERDLIDEELVLNGFSEGDAYISFLTHDPDLDNPYMEESGELIEESDNKLENLEGSTAYTTDDDPYKTYVAKQGNK